MTQDEYAVDETPAEYAISRRRRPARVVPEKVKAEPIERLRQSEAIDRASVPARQPERQ